MTPELSILKHYCTYQHWLSHRDKLYVTDFPRELQGYVRALDAHHNQNEAGTDLTVRDLANLFFATVPRDKEFHQGVFEQLEKADASTDSVEALINGIVTSNVLKDLSQQAYAVTEGKGKLEDVMKVFEDLKALNEGRLLQKDTEEFEFVSTNLETLVDKIITTPGLRWRLETLNKMLGSLRKGSFGFMFARPETGKTTLLASEVTYMAEQLKEEDGPVLWFNNEQEGEAVMLRCFQSSLNLTTVDLVRNKAKHQADFDAKMKGKFKLVDRANIHKKFVEKICAKYKPSLIVFDQIDKLVGFDNDREDLRLGGIYIWARELAKTYCPVIGVCQADGTGEGVRWLTMTHVANAKTAKQAEADWILGIGKVADVGFDSIRYLHLSKNKLIGDSTTDPALRHGRMECLIEQDRGRYVDI